MSEVYGTPYWLIHRPDYHHLLHQAALENGCEVRVKSRVKSVDESVPSITLASGETLNADIIIGADGISHSEYPNEKASNLSFDHKLSTQMYNQDYMENVPIERQSQQKISFLNQNCNISSNSQWRIAGSVPEDTSWRIPSNIKPNTISS
jgi:flavin-dependent dehydrogenase